MPSERAGRPPQPLPTASLGRQASRWVMRAMGFVLVAMAVAGWLSLVSWSANDPNITHAFGSPVVNWIGPIGAIVSDLSLQTLGLTAIILFLGPAKAGLELMRSGTLTRARLRLLLWPLALSTLAGALAALPAPGVWPMVNGLGGIVGDAVYGFAAGGLASFEVPRSGPITGLALLAASVVLLLVHLDLSAGHCIELIAGRPLFGSQIADAVCDVGPTTASHSDTAVDVDAARRPGLLGSLPAIRMPSWRWTSDKASDDAAVPDLRLEPRLDRPTSWSPKPDNDLADFESEEFDHASEIEDMLDVRPRPRAAASADLDDPEGDADNLTRSSRAMAYRFAPEAAAVSAALASFRALPVTGGDGSRGPRRRRNVASWRLPSLHLLTRPPAARRNNDASGQVLRASARLLEDVLTDFGVKAQVKSIRPGPVVTLFEVDVARGTKASRVVGLANDIARSMSAVSARIAPLAGRATIGIELPNVRRETVHLRELLESEPWRKIEARLPVALGKAIDGEPVFADLAAMPHLLVAGTTGSGKSVGLNAMILSLLYRLSPEECRMLMIDPKMLELSVYNRIPHLLAPVITDPALAAEALRWAVAEMEDRLRRMSEVGARNIDAFNERVRAMREREETGSGFASAVADDEAEASWQAERPVPGPLPYIVIVIDELADLMVVAGKDVEASLQRLAQMARAAGIHLVAATQRPSVDVITGLIKANFPTRIAFRVASRIDSRTILDEQGAEQLLGAGDMLYASGPGRNMRVHGPFVSDQEVESVATALRHQRAPSYSKSLERALDGPPLNSGTAAGRSARGDGGGEDLYDRAVAILHRDKRASASWLQKRLGIGFDRAAGLVERMEAEGLVSPADRQGRRQLRGRDGSAGSAA